MHDFPRDRLSGVNHIDRNAIREAVIALSADFDHDWVELINPEHQKMVEKPDGWNVLDALKLGAVCSSMKGLDDSDYNAALIRQALLDHALVLHQSTVPSF